LEIFLNDLSLAGQFADPFAFRAALQPLLELRSKRVDLQRTLYCSSTFSTRSATPVHSVREAIVETRDRLYIGIVLRWLSKAGPFWDEDRFPNPDDYFQFEGTDVTDQGLGEVSRRVLGGLDAGAFSFVDEAYNRFKRTPLIVLHGLEEAPLGNVEVCNFWELADIANAVDLRPTNWKMMVKKTAERFDLLTFSPTILDYLDGEPFHDGVVNRLFALLEVLQTLAYETQADGSFMAKGLELWQRHTRGDKAWFTDESETNKIEFKSELTFTNADTRERYFCTWHGKVKLNQFRIHFQWPRPSGQRHIKVMYIGPKITRK